MAALVQKVDVTFIAPSRLPQQTPVGWPATTQSLWSSQRIGTLPAPLQPPAQIGTPLLMQHSWPGSSQNSVPHRTPGSVLQVTAMSSTSNAPAVPVALTSLQFWLGGSATTVTE